MQLKRLGGLALGVLTAIGGFVDMGGIITAAQAGARHQFALLWTLVPGVIGLIDECAQPKKGDQTPGVQRQYCGASGKVDNCIVNVHLAFQWGDFKTLIEHPYSMTHSALSDRDKAAGGVHPGGVRLSVGLEDADDIISDLEAALAVA